MLLVTHDLSAALKYATLILHLGGRQLFFGSKADYVGTEICRRYAASARGEL